MLIPEGALASVVVSAMSSEFDNLIPFCFATGKVSMIAKGEADLPR
jgi:hypothetical protein